MLRSLRRRANAPPPDRTLSLDQPIDREGINALTLLDVIPDARAPDPEADARISEKREAIQRGFDVLSSRQREVLSLRFGLDGEGERSHEEIGQALGMSRQGVYLSERSALRKLRLRLAALDIRTGSEDEGPVRSESATGSKVA